MKKILLIFLVLLIGCQSNPLISDSTATIDKCICEYDDCSCKAGDFRIEWSSLIITAACSCYLKSVTAKDIMDRYLGESYVDSGQVDTLYFYVSGIKHRVLYYH